MPQFVQRHLQEAGEQHIILFISFVSLSRPLLFKKDLRPVS